jgi:hypothetical protein
MKLTKELKEQILAKSQGHCWYCGCVLISKWHIEHQNDRSNELANLVASCSECNGGKSGFNVEQFRRKILEREATTLQLYVTHVEKLAEKSALFGFDVSEQINACGEAIGDLMRAIEISEIRFFGERTADSTS